jgi:hypothetical protein
MDDHDARNRKGETENNGFIKVQLDKASTKVRAISRSNLSSQQNCYILVIFSTFFFTQHNCNVNVNFVSLTFKNRASYI